MKGFNISVDNLWVSTKFQRLKHHLWEGNVKEIEPVFALNILTCYDMLY